MELSGARGSCGPHALGKKPRAPYYFCYFGRSPGGSGVFAAPLQRRPNEKQEEQLLITSRVLMEPHCLLCLLGVRKSFVTFVGLFIS